MYLQPFILLGPGSLPVSKNKNVVDNKISKAVAEVKASPSGMAVSFMYKKSISLYILYLPAFFLFSTAIGYLNKTQNY